MLVLLFAYIGLTLQKIHIVITKIHFIRSLFDRLHEFLQTLKLKREVKVSLVYLHSTTLALSKTKKLD